MTTINLFVQRLCDYAGASKDSAEAYAWLRENRPTMDKAAQVNADLKVVAYLEERYGVEARESKQHAKLSGWTFDEQRVTQALFRARKLIEGKTKKSKKAKQTDVVAACLHYVESKKLTAAQRRSLAKKLLAE